MTDNKGYYFTPSINLSKSFSHLKNYSIGASYQLQRNDIRNNFTDSVLSTGFSYETISAFIKSDPSKQNNWSFTYTQQRDKLPSGTALTQSNHSRNFSFQASLMKNATQQLRLTATYRELYVDDSMLVIGQLPDKSLLGRIEYMVNLKKGFIVGNALYDVGAGQEQQMNYTFYQVQAGQGQYTWIDLNGDGIQQLNEFVLAAFPDQATYIKIYTPTGTYVKANYNTLNYSVSINPKMLYGNKTLKGWQLVLSKLNLQSSLQANKKELSNGLPEFDPFNRHIADSALLSYAYIFSNTLSINRLSSKWGLDVTRLVNYSKTFSTYGSQTTETDEWSFKGRMALSKTYTLDMQQKFGSNNLTYPSFSSQNFALTTLTSQPAITYTKGTKWRVAAGYVYNLQKNLEQYGGEKATSNGITLDAKYNSVQNSSISMQFSYSKISYGGDVNSTVSYTILQGLMPGKNFQWTLSFTKRLLKNIEVNFQYQGRKPGTTKLINIGTASVRAIL
jgi:hypothetical protein